MFKTKCFCFFNLFYCLISKKNTVFDKIEYHPLMLYNEITSSNSRVKTYIECQPILY
jgi:hypothetical protein